MAVASNRYAKALALAMFSFVDIYTFNMLQEDLTLDIASVVTFPWTLPYT